MGTILKILIAISGIGVLIAALTVLGLKVNEWIPWNTIIILFAIGRKVANLAWFWNMEQAWLIIKLIIAEMIAIAVLHATLAPHKHVKNHISGQ